MGMEAHRPGGTRVLGLGIVVFRHQGTLSHLLLSTKVARPDRKHLVPTEHALGPRVDCALTPCRCRPSMNQRSLDKTQRTHTRHAAWS